MSFPWSYSVLGLVPGILVTIGVAFTVLYTSLILWKYCLKYPELRDICDIGQKLFGGSVIVYNIMSYIGIFSATTMGIAIILAIIFSGIQTHPVGYVAGSEPIVMIIPVAGTTFISGMSAFLNISYTLIGQAILPLFIAEMNNPKDFPK
ncbi:hypothetical protein H0H92_012420, partial [Tricholoma furcatifolium]